ncbi:uncharacterized protein LOC105845954 isoform X2 [Hydra vulgaris]|uniref:uncharacterized protein LOC105845954 isoform X2 n=1 Tax=Hydra vulgaris TaxID=6087 RepID=UPI001F5E45C7|nr:uncharacterized protein LOC105845954 isoform X2 [Hydra vulgaris]
MSNSKNYVYCFLLIGFLESITTQYLYPAQKSLTRYSYTIYRGKKVNGTTNVVETYVEDKDCVSACYNNNKECKSIEVNIGDKNISKCRFFNNDTPNTIQADGFIYISTKLPNCSLSCNLTPNPCGKCKCYPSCAGRNRREYVCNCTLAAGPANSCQEHYDNGFTITGIFQISLNGAKFKTVCEMKKFEFQNPEGIVVRYINERVLIKNNLVATFPLLKTTYSVSFLFKPSFLPTVDTNIVHLTNKNSFSNYGERIPGVWFFTSGIIFVSSAVNGDGDYKFMTNPIPLNVWSSIQVSQTETNGIYLYSIYLNGTNIFKIVNSKTQVFTNVFVYNGDPEYGLDLSCGFIKDFIVINGNEYPWYNPQIGFINIVKNISKTNGVWIPMMTRFADWELSFWNRSFEDYENGFGLVNQQWIGLKKINQITSTFFTDMRVDYFLRKDLAFTTMYYNVLVDSSDTNYMFSYEKYDPRDSCAYQILEVSSKDVRTAIKIKLNIESKVKKV